MDKFDVVVTVGDDVTVVASKETLAEAIKTKKSIEGIEGVITVEKNGRIYG